MHLKGAKDAAKINLKHSFAGTDFMLIEFNKHLLSTNCESGTAYVLKLQNESKPVPI